MTRHNDRIVLALSLIAPVALLCSNDYNPFDNYANALIHIDAQKSSIKDNEVLNIFQTETLAVYATNREKISSFSVHADDNRYWTDTTITAPGPVMEYAYLVSFSDTGVHSITITTNRTNGDASIQPHALTCVVRSPLKQNAITGALGDSLTLSTPGVKDKVFYIWSFGTYQGRETTLKRQFAVNPGECIRGVESGKTDTGYLWVTDSLGTCQSPKSPFAYFFSDTTGPTITCINIGVHGPLKDSLVTGDDAIEFTVVVIDNSGDDIDTVALVGSSFDWVSGDRSTYKKACTGISAYSALRPEILIVRAMDVQHNATLDTFYLYYSPTGPSADLVNLRLIQPSTPSSTTRLSRISVYIGIDKAGPDTATVALSVNGVAQTPSKLVTTQSDTGIWSVGLTQGNNTVVTGATIRNVVQAETTITILCNPQAPDTQKPTIAAITVDGTGVSLSNFRVQATHSTAEVDVRAFDEISGVASVTLNGQQLTRSALTSDGWTLAAVALAHPYTTLIVAVLDSAGNAARDSVIVTRNSEPVITRPAQFPTLFYAGAAYTDTILVHDDDNDTATLQAQALPRTMKIVPAGFNTWVYTYSPLLSDTGAKSVTLSLFDPYSAKATQIPWNFFVLRDSSAVVRFVTVYDSFPRYLETGKDTLAQNIVVVNGQPAYHFAACQAAKTPRLLWSAASTVTKAKIQWVPQLSDTGYVQLVVSVRDSLGTCDTIKPYPSITVVPPNRPCTLTVSYTIPLLGNALDLTNQTAPDTLFFRVHDPDLAAVETHTVRILGLQTQSVFTLDTSMTFLYVLEPAMTMTVLQDTIRVFVTDKAGHSDSVVLPLVCGIHKTVTINPQSAAGGSIISGNVLDFPLLVRLTASNFPFARSTSDGRDVRFVKNDGSEIPFEIERWDSTAGLAEIWVRIDTVYASATQTINLYAGENSTGGVQDKYAVFDTANGIVGAWHLGDNSITTKANSAQDQYAATTVNYTTPSSAEGIIGKADSLSNTNYLSVGNPPLTTAMTVSLWVNPNSYQQYGNLFAKPLPTYASPYFLYTLQLQGATPSGFIWYVFLPGMTLVVPSSSSLLANAWTNIAATYDGRTASLYVNGVSQGSSSTSQEQPTLLPINNMPMTFGSWINMPSERINGLLDELRIYNRAMSADFVRLSYENQRLGSTVVTLY